MLYTCRTCGLVKKSIDFNHTVKICLDCCKNIVAVLTRVDLEVESTGQAYVQKFADLSDADTLILDRILDAYQKTNDIAMPAQRRSALEALDARTGRTIMRGGELAEALGMWVTHKERLAVLQDVVFLSINIRPNAELDKWVSDYAKRTRR
jgi:hypothetical protein